jgi:hypothetical protein
METFENSLGSLLVNDFGDHYLHSVNRNAFNRIGSDSLYHSLYGDKLFNEYQLNIIIGTDSGIFPNYIAKNGVPVGSRYIFLELPHVLNILSNHPVLERLPPEISVTTPDSLMKQADAYQLSNYAFLDTVRVHESVASNDANLAEYRELSWTVNLEINNALHRILTSANRFTFILRQLENLTENQICFSQVLKNAFHGRTAVILAGGPSLSEALPWVMENKDRLVVIAVSRISRILLDNGLVPHIITSVDPQEISFEVSREMLRFAESPDAPLFIHSYHVSPLLAGQWQGKSLYTGSLFPWRTPLNVDQLIYNGPTVSNYSLSLAMHLGCATIVLAGVDLCFSSEGQTHAAGSNENKVGPNLGQISPRIETYGGESADTIPAFAQSIDILSVQAQIATEKGFRIYNCSLNAAKVPFIYHKPLDEIELPNCDIPLSEVIDRCVPESTSKPRLAHYRRVKKEIERARNKFQVILNLSREALECADGLFGRNGRKRNFRHKIRMDKIERRLDQSFGDFSSLVHLFGHKRFCASLKTTMADEMTDEQVENATYEYYDVYVEGTEHLINLMDIALQRISSRVEEEKEDPDFNRIFAQWDEDKQYGRVHVWECRHPEKSQRMTSMEMDAVERLKLEFTRTMTEERTSQIDRLEKLHDVKHTRSKAILLFKRGEIAEMEVMAKGLAGHPDQDKALPYLHFINGLLAELRNETGEAVEYYQHLFTAPPHPLSEDALLQVANISITGKDIDNALIAVECLVGISPTYLPPYGELLKALGMFEEAFNAYNRYVALAPEDVGAMVSLGILCKEAGLGEAAAELFHRVLEKAPMNTAARTMLAELDDFSRQPISNA